MKQLAYYVAVLLLNSAIPMMSGFPIVVVRIHPGSSDAMLRRPLWWVARSPSVTWRFQSGEKCAMLGWDVGCVDFYFGIYVAGRVVNGESQVQ